MFPVMSRAAEQAKRKYHEDPSVREAMYRTFHERRAECKALALAYKLAHPCACGESDPRVLGFPKNRDAVIGLSRGNRKRMNSALSKGAKVKCLNCMCVKRRAIKAYGREAQRRRFLQEYKSSRGCMICGEKRGTCLDFHHPDPSLKCAAISTLMNSSFARIEAELFKCDVLCQNCHIKHELSLRAGA